MYDKLTTLRANDKVVLGQYKNVLSTDPTLAYTLKFDAPMNLNTERSLQTKAKTAKLSRNI